MQEVTKLPEWKELFEHARNWEYGSEHSHDEIAEILQIPKETTRYYQQVQRCNNELKQSAQRFMVCQKGKGYRLLKENEHLKVATKKVKGGIRQIKKGHEVAYATPVQRLNEQQRGEWNNFMDRSMRLRQFLDSENQELRKIADGKMKIEINTDRQIANCGI